MTTTVSALVIDQKAISILDRAFIEDTWRRNSKCRRTPMGCAV